MNLAEKIPAWIKQKVAGAGAKGCVFGLSGGIDSAVVAALCKRAYPDDCLALLMPCHSLKDDIIHARELADKFRIKHYKIDLTSVFEAFYNTLEGCPNKGEKDICVANIKPRLRMVALYYFANKLNYLVIGTGNKSELKMGYFTKHGDGGVDLLPLGDLLKSEVRDLAIELGVPREIVDKPPSAGLWHGQTDEEEMGITYSELDKILSDNLSGIPGEKIDLVRIREAASAHKRQLPEIFYKLA